MSPNFSIIVFVFSNMFTKVAMPVYFVCYFVVVSIEVVTAVVGMAEVAFVVAQFLPQPALQQVLLSILLQKPMIFNCNLISQKNTK